MFPYIHKLQTLNLSGVTSQHRTLYSFFIYFLNKFDPFSLFLKFCNINTIMAIEEQNKEKPSPLSCFKNVSFPFNTIFLISNAIFLVTGAFWFVTVMTLHYKTDECNRFVTTPGIFVSFSLLVMTLAGFYAAYFKSDCLFRIYLFIFFLWMFVVVAKAVFIFFLHKESNARLFPGTKIHEFRFEDYSGWVRRLVIKEDEWYRTRRCLVKDNVCNKLNQNMTASEFYQMNLTPIQVRTNVTSYINIHTDVR